MSKKITGEAFGHLFNSFEESAFRLETLDAYSIPQETPEFDRYLRGEQLPTDPNSEWVKLVADRVRLGKIMQRVRVISTPLTPYLRYEIDWGYLYSSIVGEDIRLIERSRLKPDMQAPNDYWLFDRRILIAMQYDSVGHFLFAREEDSADRVQFACDLSDSLLPLAVPLVEFLKQIRTV